MAHSKVLQVRVNDDLHDYYKGEPDKIKEALILYMRSEQNFIKSYTETLEK